MATINGKIYSRTPNQSIDAKYGPYSSADEAHDLLATNGDNVAGLTVGIFNADTGEVEDYWYYGGNDRENLVVKLRYDGSTLTVNGKTWQLQLKQPKCKAPILTLFLNVLSMMPTTPGSVVVYNIARYDEDTDSYPELPVPTLSTGILYTEPIHIQEGDNFKIVAVAVKEGWTSSDAVRTVEADGSNGSASYAEVIQYQVIGELGDDEQLGGTERLRDNGQIEF